MARASQKTQNSQINTIRLSQESMRALANYLLQCKNLAYQNWGIRDIMQRTDREYAREMDLTADGQKARIAVAYGNSDKFRNVTIPVVMPQVEAAVNYQASVFLTGTPLFGCVAPPNLMGPAKQLETIIDTQAIRGGWVDEFIMFFRDGEKYNFNIIENDWKREKLFGVSTDVASSDSNAAELTPVSWEGNVVSRWDPYNTFWDIRYGPSQVAKRGEFIGTTEMISRVELKKYLDTTPMIISSNIKAALESPTPAITISGDSTITTFFIPQIRNDALLNPQLLGSFNWLAWAGLESNGKTINYKNNYMRSKLYARIIPSDFNIEVPARNTPQIWKFEFINDTVLVYAQPVSLVQDTFPVFMGVPRHDGLDYQTKSSAENVVDFQNLTSAMMNSIVAARRRAVSDRALYDPSRVSEAQMNNPNPSAKIPVRPAAYGKPLSEAVYPFPFNDNQSQILFSDIGVLNQWADRTNGVNQARQGQFVKGNKTRREFDTVMANANGSDQMKAMVYECQVFTPLKECLKNNILEKQTPATLYSRELQAPVKIDPVAMRKATIFFKISDGLNPDEKIIGGDALKDAFNVMGTNPAIAQSYNIGPMFSYLMKTAGAELGPFEKSQQQVAYEQAVGVWQQTIQQAMESIKLVLKDVDPTKMQEVIKQFQTSLPPQPKPVDYGYDPGKNPLNTLTAPTATVLDQVGQIISATAPATAANAAPETGAQ